MYVTIVIFFLIMSVLNSCLLPFWYNKLWMLILTFSILFCVAILSILIKKKIIIDKTSFRFLKLASSVAVAVSTMNLFIAVLGYGIDVLAKQRHKTGQVTTTGQQVFDTIIKGRVLIKIFPKNIPAANARIVIEDKDGIIGIISSDVKGEFEYLLKKTIVDRKIKMSIEHTDCIPYYTEVSFIPNGVTEIEIYLNSKKSTP